MVIDSAVSGDDKRRQITDDILETYFIAKAL